MADINEILGRNISSVKELKGAINELKNSLIGVDSESEQFKTTSAQLAAAQAELNKVTKAGTADNTAATDSIRGMEQEYKKLYDTYKMLTEEQRNSDFGKNMAASLEELSGKLNDTKKDVGNFKDNIGRYAESAGQAFQGMGVSIGGLQTPLKLATGGAKTFGTALKSLAANPIVLVITALVGILVKAAEAIKKNEELSNRLNQAMAALKPVTDLIANAFDFLAGMIVKAVEGMAKAVEWISRISPKWNAAVKSHQELAKATNDLTKAQRENSVVASQKSAEIEKLREEASATEDVVEKKKLLEEAKRLQAEIDQKNIELAQEELRIMEEYAAKTANSAEDNEKLAAAQKKVNDAIAEGERNMRMYNKQLDAATTKTTSAGRATVNYRQKAKELYESLIEDSKTEVQKLTEKYEKEKKLLEKYHLDTTLLTRKYNKAIADYNKALIAQTEKDWQDAYQRELDNKKRHTDNVDKLEENELAIRITNLTKLQYSLSALSVTWDSLIEGTAEGAPTISAILKDLKENGDWETIPEALEDIPEVLRPIRELLMEISTDYGVVIKNNQDLADNIKLVDKQIIDFSNDFTMALEEKMGKEVARETANRTIDYYKTLITGLNDATTSKEYLEQFKANVGTASEYMTETLKKEYSVLEYQKGVYEALLQNEKLTFDQRTQLLQGYSDVLTQIYEKHEALANLNQQRTQEMVNNLIDMTDNIASVLSTIGGSYESLINSELKAGKIDEKEAKKKKKRLLDLKAAETAFSVATIIADAASGIFSIWKGYATETGVINTETAAAAGPAAAGVKAGLDVKSLVSAIAKTAGIASTATAQVAAAVGGYISAKNNFEAEGGGSTSTGVAATPSLVDSTPYSYTKTVQTAEEEDKLNAPIYVTVTDIEDGLGQRVKVTNESSF